MLGIEDWSLTVQIEAWNMAVDKMDIGKLNIDTKYPLKLSFKISWPAVAVGDFLGIVAKIL